MKYLCYKCGSKHNRKCVAILLDESLPDVKIVSKTGEHTLRTDTAFWIRYHKEHREYPKSHADETFEICKNQFDKFDKTGVVPLNWDW